jgi:hypothetical protein
MPSGEGALLFAQPRHVRVAEQRDAIRMQRQNLLDGVREARRRLERQTVDQVHIDAVEAECARGRDQITRGLERLNAPHRFLHFGMKILDAQTQAIESEAAKRFKMRDGGDARIDLDSDLGVRRD